MDFAVVKISGKQYKVSKGDVIEVNKLNGPKKLKVEDVLLISQGGKVKVGTPNIKGASVAFTVLGEKKGEKVRVSKFKSKVRYRKSTGFRALISQIRVEAIEV